MLDVASVNHECYMNFNDIGVTFGEISVTIGLLWVKMHKKRLMDGNSVGP